MDTKQIRRATVRKVNELVGMMEDLRDAAAEWSPDDPDGLLEIILDLKDELQVLEDAIQTGSISDGVDELGDEEDASTDDEDGDTDPLDFDGNVSYDDEE